MNEEMLASAYAFATSIIRNDDLLEAIDNHPGMAADFDPAQRWWIATEAQRLRGFIDDEPEDRPIQVGDRVMFRHPDGEIRGTVHRLFSNRGEDYCYVETAGGRLWSPRVIACHSVID